MRFRGAVSSTAHRAKAVFGRAAAATPWHARCDVAAFCIPPMFSLQGIVPCAYLAALERSLADFAGTDDFPDDVSAILLEYWGGKVAR